MPSSEQYREHKSSTPSSESSISAPTSESFQHISDISNIADSPTRAHSPFTAAAHNISSPRNQLVDLEVMSPSHENPGPQLPARTQSPTAAPQAPAPIRPYATMPPQDTYIRTYAKAPPTIQVIPDHGPNSLPVAGSKSAPPKFTGDFTKLKDFIAHYEKLCALKQVLDDDDKIQNIGQYCSKRVRTFLEGLSSYHTSIWSLFKYDFLKYYDAERDEKRYKEKDLSQYVQHTRQKNAFTTLSSWKQYDRGFIRIAGWLRAKNKINQEQLDFYFWKGIPRTLRAKIEHRLVMMNPECSFAKPFDSADVRKMAESLLQRSRFDQELLPSDDETDNNNSDLSMSDSEDESDSGSSSDDESSEEERATKARKSKHKHKKPSKKKSSRSSTSKKVKFEKPSRTKEAVPSEEEDYIRPTRTLSPAPRAVPDRSLPRARVSEQDVDGLIDQLSRMSLNDPQYAGLFLRVCTLNPYAKDAIESLQRQRALMVQTTNMHPPVPSFRNRITSREEMQTQYFDKMMCYGCNEVGHSISKCPRLADLIHRGIIIRENGRLLWPNKDPIRRLPEESWVSAVSRQGLPRSNFAAIKEQDWDDPYLYESEEELDMAESEDYDNPATYNIQYQPYDVDYDSEDAAEGYAVNRAERTIRGARKEQFDGVYMPARKELEQQRAKTRSMDKAPMQENGSRPANPDPVPHPVPPNGRQPFQPVQPKVTKANRPPGIPAAEFRKFDQSKYRSNFDPNDSDQLMEDVALPKPPPQEPAAAKPKSSPRVNRNEPEPEHRERTARRSEIQNQVDSNQVLSKLLKTPVTLAVGEVLGVSKEMSQQLQEAIKVKTTRPPVSDGKNTNPSRIDKPAANMVQAETYIAKPMRYMSPSIGMPVPSRAPLIKAKVFFGKETEEAIIDTGSQLNIVRRDFWQKFIRSPRDLSRQVVLADANGGEGQLDGEVTDVDINMGDLITKANLFVGESSPFKLLLGRPWQRGNYVSIDERKDGTYLLFKDNKMNVRFELAALVDEGPRERPDMHSYTDLVDTSCMTVMVKDNPPYAHIEEIVDEEEVVVVEDETEELKEGEEREEERKEEEIVEHVEETPEPENDESKDPPPLRDKGKQREAEPPNWEGSANQGIFGTSSYSAASSTPIGYSNGQLEYAPEFADLEAAFDEYHRRRRAGI